MKKVNVLFVNPKHTGVEKIICELVKSVCGSSFSHAAIYMFDGIYEAVIPEVTIAELSKYDDAEAKETISFEVKNEQWELMTKEAKRIIDADYKYGYVDCVVGAVSIMWGKKAAKFVNFVLGGGKHTMNCSEVVTEILRAGGIEMFDGESANYVTPQELFAELKMYINNKG